MQPIDRAASDRKKEGWGGINNNIIEYFHYKRATNLKVELIGRVMCLEKIISDPPNMAFG